MVGSVGTKREPRREISTAALLRVRRCGMARLPEGGIMRGCVSDLKEEDAAVGQPRNRNQSPVRMHQLVKGQRIGLAPLIIAQRHRRRLITPQYLGRRTMIHLVLHMSTLVIDP